MTTFERAQVRKEFRQLLPFWVAIVGGMLAMAAGETWPAGSSFLPGPHEFSLAGMVTYVIGAITLGAMSIGPEFAHETMPALLIQPVPRTRVLLVKASVLATLLAALAGAAALVFGIDLMGGGTRSVVLGWVPLACGLCLAPWLTMVCRATVGGAVLAAAATFGLFALGGYLEVPERAIGSLILILAATSGVMSWWTFTRLEVRSGRQAEIDLIGRLFHDTRAIAGRTSPRLWLLIKKELRLQQLTFAVSASFVLVWMLATAEGWWAPGLLPHWTLYIASFMHVCLIPLMAGAIASADERRFGTVAWQLLLPMRARTQWAVKAGVVVALTIGLTVELPALLMALAPDPGLHDSVANPGLIVLASLVALYVSSTSTSSVHALMATPAVLAVGLTLQGAIADLAMDAISPVGRWFAEVLPAFLLISTDHYYWWRISSIYWLALGYTMPLLYFGFVNHTGSDHAWSARARQAGWFAAYGLGGALVYLLVNALVAASVLRAQ